MVALWLLTQTLKNMGYSPMEIRAITISMLDGDSEIAKQILSGRVNEDSIKQYLERTGAQ